MVEVFNSEGKPNPRTPRKISPEIIDFITGTAEIVSDQRQSFERMLNALIAQAANEWDRRQTREEQERGASTTEIYAGDVVDALSRVGKAAQHLIELLDPNQRELGTQAAIVFLYKSFQGLDDLRESVRQLEREATALAIRERGGVDIRTGERLKGVFRWKGRPRGTAGAQHLDRLVTQLRILVHQHGGSDLTASGPGEQRPAGRETWGTLEPVVMALQPYLPEGFVPAVYFNKASRRSSKKSGS